MVRMTWVLVLLALAPQDTAYYNASPDWTAVAEPGIRTDGKPDDSFGQALAAAGDVNGDGIDDLLVGAPFRENGPEPGYGKVYLYFGSAAGLPPTAAWTSVGETFGAERFGGLLEGVGDVDADGFDDFVVGSEDISNEELFLFRGGPGGPTAVPAWRFPAESVGGAGDVNGDGFEDVLAAIFLAGPNDEGVIHLFYGSAAGLNPRPSWTYVHGDHLQDFGDELAGLGDVDRDGFDDFAIGNGVFRENPGQVHVFHGSAAGPPPSPNRRYADEHVGSFGDSVDGGDLNGDGFGDLLASASRFGLEEGAMSDVPSGRVYVYLGSPQGLPASPSFTHTPSDRAFFGGTVLNMGDLDGDGLSEVAVASSQGLEIFAGAAAGYATPSRWSHPADRNPRRLGDANGDGRTDLVVAEDADGDGSDERVAVFYGRSGGNPVPPPDDGGGDPPLPPGGEDPPPVEP